ncbi:MAG: DNA mismatch repair endonuclease MutL [Candidatus Babeliaceae bacterium]|nr:DNA mismatch repair endonuclease MutL [Candidatus Babeliaceae bacterium]
MGKINILPPHEAQKIAAGEVVERPASVVKELVENALDAGAQRIILSADDGGRKRIRLIDDGVGMSPEDARLAFCNHATSKLVSIDDLTQIKTYGFRGEALATISAVSRLTVRTREESSQEATELAVENGAVISEILVSGNRGTEIQVDDLFFNVPVRQKFLKRRETEWRAIEQLMTAFAGFHFDRFFSVEHNDRTVFHLPVASSLRDRLLQLWGVHFDEHLVACSGSDDLRGYAVNGFITRPSKTRYDRSGLFVFVNSRWVRNAKLTQALLSGFDNILPPDQYPFGMLMITVPPADVDVNIHPRKEEVRFAHPRIVDQMISQAVRSALEKVLVPRIESTFFVPASPVQGTNWRVEDIPQPRSVEWREQTVDEQMFTRSEQVFPEQAMGVAGSEQRLSVASDVPQPVVPAPKYRFLGQLLATYLLVEVDDGLLLIDQHAAHERILYEVFKKRLAASNVVQLVFPQIVPLTILEIELLLPHLSLFHEQGIEVEHFGENQLAVRAAPLHAKNCSFAEVIRETAAFIAEHESADKNLITECLRDKLCAIMACKSAVKAGDLLNDAEVNELLAKLLMTDHRTTCPHGRPTTWFFGRREIERFFQRHI